MSQQKRLLVGRWWRKRRICRKPSQMRDGLSNFFERKGPFNLIQEKLLSFSCFTCQVVFLDWLGFFCCILLTLIDTKLVYIHKCPLQHMKPNLFFNYIIIYVHVLDFKFPVSIHFGRLSGSENSLIIFIYSFFFSN